MYVNIHIHGLYNYTYITGLYYGYTKHVPLRHIQPSRQRFNSWAEFADSCGQFPLRCRSDLLETVIHW